MICPMSVAPRRKMEAFGLRVESYHFPADISDGEFKEEFQKINGDADVTGILMLRPLPKQICEKDIERDDRSEEGFRRHFPGEYRQGICRRFQRVCSMYRRGSDGSAACQ